MVITFLSCTRLLAASVCRKNASGSKLGQMAERGKKRCGDLNPLSKEIDAKEKLS
jgi:hypothetical protein